MEKKAMQLDIDPTDGVIPVSKAGANLSKLLQWIKHENRPLLITHQGYGAAVLLDVEMFKKLKDLAERSEEAQA